MSQVNLNSLIKDLDSKQRERQILAIEEATRLVETLAIKAVASLQISSNKYLVAERLTAFGSIIIPHLEKLLNESTDLEVQILASLVLLQLNSKTGVPFLLGAIKEDKHYAGLAAQHLAEAEIKDAIEPICDRLRSSNFEEIDLIVSLLDSLNKLNSKLPSDLLQRFSSDSIPWQVKTKIEEKYLSVKHLQNS